MVGNSYQGIFRPSLKPVDSATTDKTREFQGTTSEFFANLNGTDLVSLTTCQLHLKMSTNFHTIFGARVQNIAEPLT